ncbi:MAG: N-acetylneuraminate synthase family protein [Acidobacteriota bacterium]
MWRDRAVTMTIGSRLIGRGEPLYTIAEIGLNHGGSVDRALAMVDAAAAAGVSAVKVQLLTAADLVAPSCPAPAHVAATCLRDFFAAFELSESAYRAIAERARTHGLGLVATPLSLGAVDLLERVGVDAYKIASGDIIWDGLIRRCANTGKPLVMSTGMASLDEVAHAVACAQSSGADNLALLHCVSAYPVPAGSENLRAIATLWRAFGLPVGLSDHGADEFAAPLAVALGASLYERHLVLDDDERAVDAAVSSTPARMAGMVRAAARAIEALGSGEKVCLPAEAVNLSASRRSLCAARRLIAGHILRDDDLTALRPATGVAPDRASDLVGRRLARPVNAGSPLVDDDFVPSAESRLDRGVA